MTDTEKLYETLGELLYAVAKADGKIDESEKDALHKLLKDHNHKEAIQWSFDYEVSKDRSVENTYEKIIAICQRIGPSPIYDEFIAAMQTIAKADTVVDQNESDIISSFCHDLITQFQLDIEGLYQ